MRTGMLLAAIGVLVAIGYPTMADRAVTTASAWQVRQPIYKASLKRWQRYERFLAPLRAALETSD